MYDGLENHYIVYVGVLVPRTNEIFWISNILMKGDTMNTCPRCQGRMVEDFGHDQLACNWTQFSRCLNCGEIVDATILMNRRFRYDDLKDRPCKDKLKKAYSDFVRKEGQGLCLQQPHAR